MGTYTEVYFRADVDKTAFDQIVDFTDSEIRPRDPDPFWATLACRRVLKFEHANHIAYFPGAKGFRYNYRAWNADRTDIVYSIEFRNAIKNYEHEIEQFFNWVYSHVDTAGGLPSDRFIGYLQGEDDLLPTLYYIRPDGALRTAKCS